MLLIAFIVLKIWLWKVSIIFWHVFTVWSLAERGIAKASCLSVCLSVTLRYYDHIGWNSAKIILPLISLTISLSADPNMTDLLQVDLPHILAGIGVG